MSNIEERGVSFWQLISTDKITNKIEIPIIQRDYAQGRHDEKTKKIRNGFLSSIITTLEKENSFLELDFVYGNVENNILQPLDGQQRLTTLFLLHWFLAFKTNNVQENIDNFLKFTYETRISSREFCNELTKNWSDLGEGEILSEKIADSKWFFLSWKKDPTIKAMLTMLDAIEEKLKDKTISELFLFWEKITSHQPPVTFYFKKLNDVGLTDDLYIKMNARGKALTEFENFKAQFEKYIKESNPEQIDWEADLKDSPTETFSHKIDTIWTDLFWKHRGNDDVIDDEFVKFIAGIAIINYAKNSEIAENLQDHEKVKKALENKLNHKIAITDEAIKKERIERKIQLLFRFPNEISPDDFPTKKAFDYLVQCLDTYSNGTNDEIIPGNVPLWEYCKKEKVDINSLTKIDNNLFIEFIKNNETTYKQRSLFFAQTQYLLNTKEVNQEFFSAWMRVIRNIVQNTTIDSASGYVNAIGLINELSKGSNDIYKYLTENEIKSGVSANQVSEEKLKASISKFKNVISVMEDTNFCKGRIKFSLDCLEFDEKNPESFSPEKLEKIRTVIETHFNENDISNDFRRGLFTIKDNQFYNYWWSWLYAVNAPKRCLIENITDLKNFAYNDNFKKYLIELVQKLTENDLETIISNYEIPSNMPNWKKIIIKEKGILDASHQHYIAIKEDQSCCWLIPQSKVANSREGVEKCKQIK
ncbi:DUF262 domain-containing protein [Flavobacterium sp. FlaQc-48]|uniref:GmrSD restriction endonuclease domain-containing protein n=1 Tax=Flavobacterium sp. FlaQc-48 TaxID=3374181 RepID=UPI003756B4F8